MRAVLLGNHGNLLVDTFGRFDSPKQSRFDRYSYWLKHLWLKLCLKHKKCTKSGPTGSKSCFHSILIFNYANEANHLSETPRKPVALSTPKFSWPSLRPLHDTYLIFLSFQPFFVRKSTLLFIKSLLESR